MSELMKGATILTLGLFLSKFLGLVYIFPFYAIVGEENVGLYQYAYIPYNIMLSIAISGFPLAVSKFVSKYNALGDYEAGHRLMKSGVWAMILSGIASFAILNLLATPIAHIVIADDEQIYSVDQIAEVIRWVSFALIVVPFMSLFRGFFQGYGQYMPTSASQLVEQIARIIVLLGGSFLVIVVFKGEPATAINFAVFAAFIGALAGIGVLYFYWKKFRGDLNEKLATSVSSGYLSYPKIYKEVITYSIPFVIVGLAGSLFQLVDMLTFNKTMNSIGLAKVTDIYFMMLNFSTHKVVMIPVMLATGLSMALIPTITKYYTLGEFDLLRGALDKTYQILLFITLPAVFGISILAPEIYHVLYEQSDMGAMVLAHYAPVAILFALFTVSAALLQGIDYQKWVVFSLLTGLLVKLVLNISLIKLFEVDGAIIATALGYLTSITINIVVIHRTLNYRSLMVKRRILLIFILTAIMAITVGLVDAMLNMIAPAQSKLLAFLYSMICIAIGVGTYGYLSLRLGLAQKLLGARVVKIANKLGFK